MSIQNAPLRPTLSAPVGVNPILNAVRARTELVAPVLLDSRAASKDARVPGGGAMSLGGARAKDRGRELNQDEWAKVVAGRPSGREVKGTGSGQASPSVRSTRANSPVSVLHAKERDRDSGSRGRFADDASSASALADECVSSCLRSCSPWLTSRPLRRIVSATEAVAPHKIETTLVRLSDRALQSTRLTPPRSWTRTSGAGSSASRDPGATRPPSSCACPFSSRSTTPPTASRASRSRSIHWSRSRAARTSSASSTTAASARIP